MTILFFIDSLRAGGKERRFVELLKGLKSFPSIQFEIVVMSEDIHYREVFSLEKKIHFLLRKKKKDLSVFKKFYKICKLYKPDIVHTWDDMTAIISIPTCKLLNIKLINGMVADTPVKRLLNKSWLMAKLAFPFSDKIIGNSKAGLTAYGAPSRKSVCIYNGLDFTRFENLNDANHFRKEIFGQINNGKVVVGMVAAFEPRKDYKTLIKGAISLLSSNASLRFVLVGNGSEFIELKNSVPAQFKDKIIFLGRRNDIESIVNLFDIGVLLTNSKVHGEGISNSIIEYMALAKPVIATRGGGTNEIVIDNENGFLINTKDSNEFINNLQRLIINKELRNQLGSRAFETAHQKFDLKKVTAEYVSVYQSLLEINKN
jgi:glycosyltransferase involved in cell wall biosynthesis